MTEDQIKEAAGLIDQRHTLMAILKTYEAEVRPCDYRPYELAVVQNSSVTYQIHRIFTFSREDMEFLINLELDRIKEKLDALLS